MVEDFPQILASEEKATTLALIHGCTNLKITVYIRNYILL